jgi:hypothetical protein
MITASIPSHYNATYVASAFLAQPGKSKRSADLVWRSAAFSFQSLRSQSAGQSTPWGNKARGCKPRSNDRMWPMAREGVKEFKATY